MSPEERQLLVGLFERTKGAAAGPRDQEAEAFIAEQVKAQPAAPYLLAQAVIVQEQALEGANARIEELQGRVRELESKPAGGGFLSGLFGGGQRPLGPPPGSTERPSGPWGSQQPQGYPGGQPGFAPSPQGYAAPQAAPAGGSFLKGALGTAAGVAGGVLLADSIRGLFSHGGMGGMGNFGIGSGFTPASETTIVNNYFGDEPGAGAQDAGYEPGYDDSSNMQDADWSDSGDDDGGDGGFDV